MNVPTRAKVYLSKALDADVHAESCVTQTARNAWQDVAKQYRHLALLAERNFGR
jgi:hypothetical protein